MDEKEQLTQAKAFIQKYDKDFEILYKYVPWLMEKGAKDVAHDYDGELGHSSLNFPVYDGTLMSFVRTAQKTVFMNKNYAYAYTRRHIKSTTDEQKYIDNATIRDDDYLNAVISKYVQEGMRKSGVWQDAVERKLFLNVLLKYKELLDYNKRFC